MALERIDPIQSEDRFCLDHLLRYLWAQPAVDGQRVLDAACGLGFGTALLAHGNAAAVVGVDMDAATIARCQEWWPHPRVAFRMAAIEELGGLGLEPFDRIVSFETLEHTADPDRALAALRGVLKPDGLLLGSVPGETDWAEDNEFHLHFFNPARLEKLLAGHFRHVRLFRQRYHLASLIEGMEDASAEVIHPETLESARLDFGRSPAWADTLLFAASEADLPDWPARVHAQSRQAWLGYCNESGRAARELKRLSGRFRELFHQHGDLLRRFSNTLAWGRFYHQTATGKPPETHYLEKIGHAQSAREAELRGEVDRLQRELEALRGRLQELEPVQHARADASRKALLANRRPPPASPSPSVS